MSTFVRLLIEAWTRLYTLGLPPSVRQQRIDLIRADVFDHCADAEDADRALAFALAGRWLRGVSADLTWRMFDARRTATVAPVLEAERRPVMTSKAKTQFYFMAACLAWMAVLVIAVEAPTRSFTWAGAVLGVTAVIAWSLDALSMPDEAAPSPWPLLLAVGVCAIAGGIVFDGGYTGLLIVVPLAVVLTAVFLRRLQACRTRGEAAGAGPLPDTDLTLHARTGDVIAIERREGRGISRRALLQGGFGVGLTSVFAAAGGIVVDFLWRRNVAGFGGVVTAGPVEDFPPGSKTIVREGKFWLVNLTREQGGPGYLALWQKCPHLGCVVPWEDDFTVVDPKSGESTQGWFRCPCHQSTYNDAGVRVYGPAPRSLDRMALTITEDGYIEVNTGEISKGSDDNPTFAIPPESPRL